MTNDELQRAITVALNAHEDDHAAALMKIQLERARATAIPETQEPPLEFSRGQRLRSDVVNAQALLKRCGFQVVIIDVDKYSAL